MNEIIREHQAEKSAAAAKAGRDSSLGGGAGALNRSTAKEEMPVPIDMALVGKIIGRGGETIRRLSEESGARLQIERDQSRVMIRGDHEACVRARELILDVLNDPNPRARAAGAAPGTTSSTDARGGGARGRSSGKAARASASCASARARRSRSTRTSGRSTSPERRTTSTPPSPRCRPSSTRGRRCTCGRGGCPAKAATAATGGVRRERRRRRRGGAAAPPADKPLWETHKSPEGYTYYYNTTTGETQWDMPDDFPGVAPP